MTEISKIYQPKEVEKKWYALWLEKGCFRGKIDRSKEPYSIVIPPPNVTGKLTMGHVLNNTIQDILIRRARNKGKAVLWLPGTDHAGIATQTKVERQLRQEGITREELGREKFLERATSWRDEHGGLIVEQLKRLGASCDWERSVHTLDPEYSKGVLTAFVKLYKKGLIYRGSRMVNWCPVSLTALSDEEVIMKAQKGFLYYVRYDIVESPGEFLTVATTRPETIMADVAVAVHPKDKRYKHLIGQHCFRPLLREKIPIIAEETVDQKFGTGVLKITPAHDKTDLEIGTRHQLPILEIIAPDGTLNERAGPDFRGMDRFKARKVACQKLAEENRLLKEEPYENNVGYSERGGVPIEPRLSEQWFLRYPQVETAKRVVREGLIQFWPKRWVKTYLHWLENIQDWCISRQLWWGHRIPVWYPKGKNRMDPKSWHISVEGPPDPENWEQDEDSLDTWASSWIWPFATMGWPHPTEEQKKELSFWYPTSDLVTGPDIIFFWVARMIMAALEFMGEDTSPEKSKIPFKNVYFTGIIRDSQGRKMSKSLGNSPDPVELIEKYGADGLRYGVMSCAPQGQDILFCEDRVKQGRNFCNKLWNACRFRQMAGAPAKNKLSSILERLNPKDFDEDDHAILGSLLQMSDAIEKDFENYELSAVTQKIYTFFWKDFCDWYLEVSKIKMQHETSQKTCLSIQDFCIRQVLLLLHPFVPFLTEELWQDLGYGEEGKFLQDTFLLTGTDLATMLQKYGIKLKRAAIEEVAKLREFVSAGRALKAKNHLGAKTDATFFYHTDVMEQRQFLQNHAEKVKRLMGASSLTYEKILPKCPTTVTEIGILALETTRRDPAECNRLEKELHTVEKIIAGIQSKLSNAEFLQKAPEQIVTGAKKQLKENQIRQKKLHTLLKKPPRM